MKLSYVNFIHLDVYNRWWIKTTPNTHDCRACIYYRRNNNRHGLCNLFKSDTCVDASCSYYQYLIGAIKL